MTQAPAPAATFGLVLVGGASRRMGVDKATLDFEGQDLASVAVQALAESGVATVATVGPFEIDGAHRCEDLWPGAGPLGGIVSGLAWAETHAENAEVALAAVVVLACDLPFVDAEAVTGLFRAASAPEAGEDGVLGFDGERSQPLFSLLRRASFAKIATAFNLGARSPMQVLDTLSLSVASAVDDGRLVDVDTPDQLAAARRRDPGFPEIPPRSG